MQHAVANPFRRSVPLWEPSVEDPFRASDIAALHHSVPGYAPTPLVGLPALALRLGVGRILVKDESHRFGLKAFKALGASYAVYRFVKEHLEKSGRPCPEPSRFFRGGGIIRPEEFTFCTATDGNHGRGVAWIALQLGQKAVIYMPAGSVSARIENIRGEGAEVVVVDGTYDDAVLQCAEDARVHGWQVISDTSWPGYERIPKWIMAGYLTLFREVAEAVGESRIDLVIIQGGVGALAGAAAWYLRRESPWPEARLVSVEPVEAACLLESAASPDGEPVISRGKQDSIMAGLNCGSPSPVAWPLIRQGFDLFVAINDSACTEAMRRYYHPLESDPRILSGESGAAGLAALATLMQDNTFAEARNLTGLGPETTVLLINTEGDTDPVGFNAAVRDHPRK
jgi:diaminopropionate ammonia-lyase